MKFTIFYSSTSLHGMESKFPLGMTLRNRSWQMKWLAWPSRSLDFQSNNFWLVNYTLVTWPRIWCHVLLASVKGFPCFEPIPYTEVSSFSKHFAITPLLCSKLSFWKAKVVKNRQGLRRSTHWFGMRGRSSLKVTVLRTSYINWKSAIIC